MQIDPSPFCALQIYDARCIPAKPLYIDRLHKDRARGKPGSVATVKLLSMSWSKKALGANYYYSRLWTLLRAALVILCSLCFMHSYILGKFMYKISI